MSVGDRSALRGAVGSFAQKVGAVSRRRGARAGSPGATPCVEPTSAHEPPSHRDRSRRRGFLGIAAVSLVLLTAGTCKKPPHEISDVSETFEPRGVAWNGVKVYLSSPRHASSGGRGECGWEENINGRIFNLYAADLNDSGETLSTRGYQTRVSPNPRDDGWRLNRDESNNWGADVHIVTHTNAYVGCDNPAQYLLVMFKTGDANSIGLKDELLEHLDPQVPGGQNSWNCDTLGECAAAAPHMAYIELFFHTNQAAADWFVGPLGDKQATGAMAASPQLGAALDEHLGRPRAATETQTTQTLSQLDSYAGFGQSAEAVQRDETIAYWEAFQREQLVRECMADAGFDYAPAVAFPAGDQREVAQSLGVTEEQTALSPSEVVPPARWNRDYERALPDQERERYSRSLLGESAADVAEADRTGVVPAGRRADEFATGGCLGEAEAAVPSIWDTRRDLAPELDALRRNDDDREAPARFVERHARRLDAAARRYDGVLERIAADEPFTAYLASQVAALD